MHSPANRAGASRPLPTIPTRRPLDPRQPESAAIPLEPPEPTFSLDTVLVLLAGTAIGTVLAAVVIPNLVPDLAASLLGDQPKAFWYLSRSSGIVAYLALWLAMVLGLSLTNRFARLWAGGPAVADVHQFSSLLALVLVVFHVVILLGDRYAEYRVEQLLIPFTAWQHEPIWVGLGQIALYLALLVTFTSYARRTIGVRAWRLIHYTSFGVFVLVLAHGIGAGTDSSSGVMLAVYLLTGCSVVFLMAYRILMALARRGVGRGQGRGVYSFPGGSGTTVNQIDAASR